MVKSKDCQKVPKTAKKCQEVPNDAKWFIMDFWEGIAIINDYSENSMGKYAKIISNRKIFIIHIMCTKNKENSNK